MTDLPTHAPTHAPAHGPIPGADPAERAVAIAGLLAELGLQTLELSSPGAPAQPLHARTTDLPGLLARHAPCRLAAPGLTIDVAHAAAAWHAAPELAAQIIRRLK